MPSNTMLGLNPPTYRPPTFRIRYMGTANDGSSCRNQPSLAGTLQEVRRSLAKSPPSLPYLPYGTRSVVQTAITAIATPKSSSNVAIHSRRNRSFPSCSQECRDSSENICTRLLDFTDLHPAPPTSYCHGASPNCKLVLVTIQISHSYENVEGTFQHVPLSRHWQPDTRHSSPPTGPTYWEGAPVPAVPLLL